MSEHKPYSRISVADHSIDPPTYFEADGAPTWVTRGSNFVIAITRAAQGTQIFNANVADEHFVLLPDCGARIAVSGKTHEVLGNHLVIVPPGSSELIASATGLFVRCFSARNVELLARAANASAFHERREQVAPAVEWPEPIGGFAMRIYNLEEGLVAGDKTRVFRSSNMMINILRERTQPRDTRTLSPHAHADFEQASITLSGVHVHHLRTPWVADMSVWRPDEAVEVGSPSVTIIPPPIIHTTRNIGDGRALLVDLFCPPREDFSRRPGMVRNAAEYPLPAYLQDA